jgi:cytochrome P450
MQAITLEVILRAVFGVSSHADLERYRPPLQRFLRDAGSFLILVPALRKDLGPRSPWGHFVRLREDVRRMVEAEIARRRDTPELGSRTDVLSFLLAARDEEGKGLDDLDLRDELITMLLAGQDTTATALAWTCDLLVHNRRVLARLVEDLDRGSDAYLDAVIKEVLRLRPTIPEVGRTLSQPTSIGGHELPTGTAVTPSLILIHRRPELYPDPLVFRPERFLERTHDLQTWHPFGGGIRHCLGATFATMEMRVVLRTVLSTLRLSPASKRSSRARRRAVTLIPRTGARVVARRR